MLSFEVFWKGSLRGKGMKGRAKRNGSGFGIEQFEQRVLLSANVATVSQGKVKGR